LGPANLPLSDLPGSAIVWQLRLPRAVLAFLVGGALGVAGTSLQALVRNPLADPFLLGLSGGAGLGAVAAIALHLPGPWALPLAAFVGAVGAMALVYRLGLVGGAELDPRILLLGGVAVGALAGAITTAIVSLAEATELRNAFLWLWGGFSGASWTTVLVMLAYAPLPLGVLVAAARPLDLLALGEEPAQYLGADVRRLKRVVYLAASLLTAAARDSLVAVSLEVRAGEFHAVLGPNGSGKTTLVRAALGLVRPVAGDVEVLGRPAPGWSRRDLARVAGVLPQREDNLFPQRVRETVLLGRYPH